LQELPGDADALRALAVAELEEGDAAAALAALEQLPEEEEEGSDALLRAYALYAAGRSAEGLGACPAGADGLALRGQMLRQLGRHAEAAAAFRELLETPALRQAFPQHLLTDLGSNLVASEVTAAGETGRPAEGVPESLQALGLSPQDSMELAFNVGVALAGAGQVEDADFLLERALSLGREDLAEQGLEENEIEVELAAVETERAWLQSLRGRGEEAMAAYSQVLLRGGKNDATVQAVTANNLACLKGTLHVAESLKRLEKVVPLGKAAPGGRKGATAAKEEERVPEALRPQVYAGAALLCTHAKRFDAGLGLADRLRSLRPGSAGPVALAAGVLAQAGRFSEARKRLEEFLGQGSPAPAERGAAQLALAQVEAMAGEPGAAAGRLQELAAGSGSGTGAEPGLGHQPAVVATTAALLERLGELDPAREATAVPRLLEAAAGLTLRHGAVGEAAQLYLELAQEQGSSDPASFAGALEGALGAGAPPAEVARLARQQASALRPLAAVDALDADTLEQGASERMPAASKDAIGDDKGSGMDAWAALASLKGAEKRRQLLKLLPAERVEVVLERRRQRAKKRRAAALKKREEPWKNPVDKLDPERWLPKYERAAFKKKRKKDVGKGGQGAGMVDDRLDQALKPAEAGGVMTPPQGRAKGKGKPKGKGKKGKRR
jgi:signal recognition particle subunit SRP72